jgi:hypothetical protein
MNPIARIMKRHIKTQDLTRRQVVVCDRADL